VRRTPEAGEEDGEEGEGLSLWFAAAAAAALAYHSGTPEANRTNDLHRTEKAPDLHVPALQIAPEIGFFASDSLVLSLQGRIQVVTGASAVNGSQVAGNSSACRGGTCHPSNYALRVATVTWFVAEAQKGHASYPWLRAQVRFATWSTSPNRT